MLRTFSPWRLRTIGWMLTLAFLACAGRLFYLHVVANPKLHKISEGNRVRLETHPAKRGEIVDRNGELLATHQTRFVVGVDAQDVDEKQRSLWPQLAQELNLPLQQIEAAVASGKRWTKLRDGLDDSAHRQLQALKIKGVYGYPTYDRIYPKGEMAAHLLGFVNKEHAATMGVERMMDFYLKGEEGWRETERDGKRRELGQFRSREVPAQNGLSVELTVDARVQAELEEQIKKIVQDLNPESAAIIVSDPASGAILGLANYPTYDPNHYNRYPPENLKNHALSDVLEPGSTFKAVTVAAALQEGLIIPETTFNCAAETAPYRGKELRLPKEHDPLGTLNVRDIIAQSSNKGAAQIGMRLGEEKLYEYAYNFGFGQATGLGLEGESIGILPKLKNWDGLTITRMPMGHAVAATALQIHCAMSVIARGGVLMQPQVIRRVYDENGNTVLEFEPRPRRRVVDSSTAKLMCELLVKTVSPQGTAEKAYIAGYQVAGKTGTTQKIVNGRYTDKAHIASFAGFFPAGEPKLVITVIVDTPKTRGVGYGGQVAAPVFKNIATRLIQHLGLAPVEQPPAPTRGAGPQTHR